MKTAEEILSDMAEMLLYARYDKEELILTKENIKKIYKLIYDEELK